MKIALKLILFFLCLLCTGCAPAQTQPPTSSTSPVSQRISPPGKTNCALLLRDIWNQYDPQEQFSVYGGMQQRPVPEAPGDLDMEEPVLWFSQYCLPAAHQQHILQGASLQHLLSGNLFTAAAFQVESDALPAFARDWRAELLSSHWVNGPPQRLLLAQVNQEYLVMAFGSRRHTKSFQRMLLYTYPSAQILCCEPFSL